ncbi:MAG: hypothetical protein LBK72_11070 [Bifidobacteriaceae bacterium]|jgi:hypothetical protein|nr:hypothetical protein [Bifidobacteriaceae bacterium]
MDNTHVRETTDPVIAISGRMSAADINAVRLLVASGLVAPVAGALGGALAVQAA